LTLLPQDKIFIPIRFKDQNLVFLTKSLKI